MNTVVLYHMYEVRVQYSRTEFCTSLVAMRARSRNSPWKESRHSIEAKPYRNFFFDETEELPFAGVGNSISVP